MRPPSPATIHPLTATLSAKIAVAAGVVCGRTLLLGLVAMVFIIFSGGHPG